MNEKRTINYREDIDGLRSLAVLLVLVFHFKLVSYGKGGFLGVDIFFVISGFLITSIIIKQLDKNTFSFKEFYIRRIRRLAPALFAVLIMVLIVGGIVLLPTDFEELSRQLFATQLYFSNFYFWQNLNYFGLKSDSTILLHTWSLAVEEQFYLLFPLVLFFLHKYQRKLISHWIVIGIISSFFLNMYFVDKKPELTFYLMPTRGWELLSGAAIIYLLHLKIINSKIFSNAIGLTGLLIIFFSVLNYSNEVSFPGFYALMPVIGTMLLIVSGTNNSSLTYKIFSNPIAVYIGKISYSLYLVHWPVNVFASMSLGEGYSLFWRMGMFILTFIISILLYHYIESPVREGTLFKSKDKHYKYYFQGVSITLVIFSLVILTKGLPFRFSDDVIYYANFVSDKAPDKYSNCSYNDQKQILLKEDLCILGDLESSTDWVIIGDSHALAASAAFDIWLKEEKKSAYFIYRHACPPLFGLDLFKSKGECYRYNQKTYEFILKTNKIKNVVLISAWLQAKEGVLTTDSRVKFNSKDSIDIFKKQFSQSLTLLKDNNRNAYIWSPVPGANGNVPKILAKSKDFDKSVSGLEKTLQDHLEQFDFFYETMRINENKIFGFILPYEELCKSGRCRVLNDKDPLYFDNAHIAYSSSSFWSELIKTQMK